MIFLLRSDWQAANATFLPHSRPSCLWRVSRAEVTFSQNYIANSNILVTFAAEMIKDMERIKAVILLLINCIVWIFTFILSIPFALFFWLKRILVKTK